ncbi:MAG: polysaccharide deacetylase family protein [Clostridia bacterium]|nr:polysaccharide deacetylase family protein [Clostridia bacterium]
MKLKWRAICLTLSAAMLFAWSPAFAADDYIRWVDFTPTYSVMRQALRYDLESYGQEVHLDWIELLAALAAQTGGRFPDKASPALDKIAGRLQAGELMEDITGEQKYYVYYLEAYQAVLDGPVGEYYDADGVLCYGLKGFCPLAAGYGFSHYEDFGNARSFGFKRVHLGNDLMGAVGTPVIAVEDGVVEALGWNRYGGWRVGIRSGNGRRYYYYAHLRRGHPYVKTLKEGDTVKAGDVIGYLGMTGYSDREDVNNITTPHLHFGLQLIFDESQKESNSEIWVDVYELVELLGHNRAKVTRDEGAEDYRRAGGAAGNELSVFVPQDRQADAGLETRERIPLPIVMYHSLYAHPASPSPYVLPPSMFEQDVRWLLEHGYTPVSVQSVLEYREYGTKLPEKPVMLTFDDGFYNYLTDLLPIVEKYEVPVLVNVVGSFTETAAADDDKHPAYSYLDWQDLQELTAEGWVELGNHSYAMHQKKPRLGASRIQGETIEAYKANLSRDTGMMQQLLREKLGIESRVYAYPYGAVSGESKAILHEMGYEMLLNCGEYPNFITREPDSLMALGRYNRDSRLTTEAFMEKLLSGYTE